MALQHVRSNTADKRPVATNLADGQLAVNYHADSPGLFAKDSNNALFKIGPIHVGATAPNVSPAGSSGNSKGEGWLDTSGSNAVLKVWNGSSWSVVTPVASGSVVSTADTGTVTSTMIANGAITNDDINASAAIALSKLATGALPTDITVASANIVNGTIVDADINASAAIAHSKLANITAGQVLLGNASNVPTATAVSGDITISSTGVTTIKSDVALPGAPTAATAAAGTNTTQLATTAFVTTAVDAAKQGLTYKAACRAATTANITLSGTQVVDGVTLAAGNRVLVKDQSSAPENGVYLVAAGAWTRATDFDASADLTDGAFVFVKEGTANADTGWVLSTDGTITVGTTALTFIQFSGAGTYSAGNGLQLNGVQFSLAALPSANLLIGNGSNVATATAVSGDVTISNSGVTAIGAGKVTNTMLAGSIADSKLSTISTAGKVSNSATTATDLNTPSAIVSRDASGNFSAGTITAALSGNASTATALQTARTINGVSFDGTSNITIPSSTGSSLTFNSGGAGAVSGSSFNGEDPLTISYNSIGAATTDGSNASGTWGISITGSSASTSGNAATATTLQTSRTINGTNFNGSANIVTSYWGSARTLTVGGTGKSVDGSGNVSWSLTEIGAPSTTGTGASGTWGIGITGNAATATKLSSTRTFALTGDVTGSIDSDLTSGASIVAAIGTGVIVNADINNSAAIAHSKLASITAGQILLGNASNVPTATAMSGDVTINSSGVTAISSGVIVNTDINASAAIADTKLATISTAGKVANSATTATSSNTASAIVARDASGDVQITSINSGPLAGFRNAVMNGKFDIWTRGTSFSFASSLIFTADRWFYSGNGTGTRSVSRQPVPIGTVFPGNPKWFLRINQTTSGSGTTYSAFRQKIEGVRTFEGSTVSIGFWAKSSSSSAFSSVRLTQKFGTGGTPSSDASHQFVGTLSLTPTWTFYSYTLTLGSLSGKTLGTNGDDHLELSFGTPSNTTWEFDIACVQLEPGATSTLFETRPLQTEQALCQRYYYGPTHPRGYIGSGTGRANIYIDFPVEMFKVPNASYSIEVGTGIGVTSTTMGSNIVGDAAGGGDNQRIGLDNLYFDAEL